MKTKERRKKEDKAGKKERKYLLRKHRIKIDEELRIKSFNYPG